MMDGDGLRERSLRTWDAVATGWDARRSFLEQNLRSLDDWIVERTSPTAGDVVLEVGAGPGDLSQRIAVLVGPAGRVICSDFSPAMVEVARRAGASSGSDNVDFRQLDAEAIDLDDASVDAVVGRSVFMLLADRAAALREARRVLRSDGSLAFTAFTSPERNPWWSVPASVLVQHGHLAPPPPGAPGVFSLGDPERVDALAVGAGFSPPTIEEIGFVFHYVDAADAWSAIVDLNGPLAVTIGGLSADDVEVTRRSVLEGYQSFRDADGSYAVPAQVLAVHAR